MNNPLDMKTPAPLLALRDVRRSYLQGTVKLDVLTDASLSVRAGEMKALVGPSGSGKSTLLNIAGLLERPDAGEVLIDGVDAGKLGRAKRGDLRRSHIGFVFQFHRLFPEFSARENVIIPQMLNGLTYKKADERATALLAMVGLEERTDHRPGLLSGGEQQRVAIARALLNHPELIIADEPTGNLDPETSQEIMQLFQKLHQGGISIIMATHDYNMIVKFPGKIFQCDQGSLNEVVRKK